MRSHAQRPSRRPRARGFTLVELLVVIGVMSILASLLLGVVTNAQREARKASCRNNLSQTYKCARLYANNCRDLLPDLYAGINPAAGETGFDYTVQNKRYRESHYSRNTSGDPAREVPAGLWLLVVTKFCEQPEVLYCPNTSGKRRPDGTENPTESLVVVPGQRAQDVPQAAGYAYNYFPDPDATGLNVLARPPGLLAEDVSSDLSQQRARAFYCLMADVFITDNRVPHGTRSGLNTCHWDGSVQWATTSAREIPWNNDESATERTFTDNMAGYEHVRDAWVFLSEQRK